MKESLFLVLLSCIALSFGASIRSLNPAIHAEAQFDASNIGAAAELMTVQVGPVSLAVAKGENKKIAFGGGIYETTPLFSNNYGKVSLKGMTTVDGDYQAILDTELYRGSGSYNPLTLTVTKGPEGLQYSATTALGFVGGTYEGSDGSFQMHLDADGWVMAKVNGIYRNKDIDFRRYNAAIDLGLVSYSADWDDTGLEYEVGASLGILYGSLRFDKQTTQITYKAGVSLGIVKFDVTINKDKSRIFSTQIDTGILQVDYTADPHNDDYSYHGILNASNMAIDYGQNKEGVSMGGRLEIFGAVINIHRDPNGKYTVKVDRGLMIE